MLSFSEWRKIYEARKNPEQNPKISAYEKLKPYINKNNFYISFTTIDKLGLHPRSKFNTPLGIYSYPLQEIAINQNWNEYKEVNVPFAGDREFIWLFKPKNPDRVLELSKYDSADWDRDKKVLKEMAKKYGVLKYLNGIISKAKYEARIKNPGGYMWYVTKELSEIIETESKRKAIVIWNEIFRKMGYDGITDKFGQGIIHEFEPIQAVWFSKNGIEVIEKILNKNYNKKTTRYTFSGKVYSFYPREDSEINYPIISYSVKGDVFEDNFNKPYEFVRTNIFKLKNNHITLDEFENNIEKHFSKVYNCNDVEINLNIEFNGINRGLKKSGVKFLNYLFEKLSYENFRKIITEYNLYEINDFLNEIEKLIIKIYGEESEELKYFNERK